MARVWKAFASSVARAMCPGVVYALKPEGNGQMALGAPLDKPISNPPAPGSQYGARRPLKAVTKYTPPVVSDFPAKVLISSADEIRHI